MGPDDQAIEKEGHSFRNFPEQRKIMHKLSIGWPSELVFYGETIPLAHQRVVESILKKSNCLVEQDHLQPEGILV